MNQRAVYRRRRLHPHAVEGDLGGASVLRLRGVEGVRHRRRRTPTRRCSRRSSTPPPSRTKAENRKQIAEAIAPANYINQPVTVLEQILTGTFADGLGSMQKVPNRVDFDPFPWESFAVWIMTQMKRWGQIKGDVDYAGVAKQVFLATDTTRLMKEVGLTPPAATTKSFVGHGQDLRSGQARGLHQELRHQAGVTHAGIARTRPRCDAPRRRRRRSRSAPSPRPSPAGRGSGGAA